MTTRETSEAVATAHVRRTWVWPALGVLLLVIVAQAAFIVRLDRQVSAHEKTLQEQSRVIEDARQAMASVVQRVDGLRGEVTDAQIDATQFELDVQDLAHKIELAFEDVYESIARGSNSSFTCYSDGLGNSVTCQ